MKYSAQPTISQVRGAFPNVRDNRFAPRSGAHSPDRHVGRRRSATILASVPAILGHVFPRRWLIVFAAGVAMMLGFGAVSSFSVFMLPLQNEFLAERGDIAFAYTLASLGVAAGGLIWGRLVDRIDTRPVVSLGAIALGGSLLSLSQLNDLTMVYGASFILGAFGFACLYAPLLATVGLWFEKRRGLAIGVVTAGGAVGQGLVPLFAQALIADLGWREAYFYMGVAYLLVLAPLMLLVTRPNRDRSAAAAACEGAAWAMSPRRAVSLISVAAFLCCVCMVVPNIHLVSLMRDAGHSASSASSVMMFLMLVAAVARIVFGLMSDRIGAVRTYLLASLIQTASVPLFLYATSLEAMFAAALVFGFGFAGNNTGFVLCVREAVPGRSAGTATAIVSFIAWLGMGAGGFAGGRLYDLSGNYGVAFAAAAVAGLGNILVLIAILKLKNARRPSPEVAMLPTFQAAIART